MEQSNNQKIVQVVDLKVASNLNPADQNKQVSNLKISDSKGQTSKRRAPNLPAWLIKPVGEICVSQLSDNDLYQKCREYGMNAKQWSRKFAGLLPEVARRGLHRKKGFISIQEFAGKLAGMSEYAVDKILHLAKHLENKPVLKKLFESGAEGWSKMEKVAYIATTETDKTWADKVTLLSTRALETLVQNYRSNCTHVSEKENITLFSQEAGVDGEVQNPNFEPPVRFSFPASKEVEFDLRLAKQKLEKQSKQALSWNEAFQMLIQKSELVSVKTCKFAEEGILKKYSGFCTKCRKKSQIQNVQMCEECARRIQSTQV